MAKCRMLIQENEDLGRMISSGRIAKLDGDIALARTFIDEMKQSQAGTVMWCCSQQKFLVHSPVRTLRCILTKCWIKYFDQMFRSWIKIKIKIGSSITKIPLRNDLIRISHSWRIRDWQWLGSDCIPGCGAAAAIHFIHSIPFHLIMLMILNNFFQHFVQVGGHFI